MFGAQTGAPLLHKDINELMSRQAVIEKNIQEDESSDAAEPDV